MEDRRKQKSVIVVKSKERGARTKVTACAYSPDGRMIGGGVWFRYVLLEIQDAKGFTACLDGAIHMWQASSNFVRPNLSIEGAHVKGTETGSMVFSVDGRTVLTRGGDDTVKCKSKFICLQLTLTRIHLDSMGFTGVQKAIVHPIRLVDPVPEHQCDLQSG